MEKENYIYCVKQSKRPTTLLAIVGCLAILAAWGCRQTQKETMETIVDIQKREGVPVTTIAVPKKNLRVIERMGGTIEGYNQSVISASIPATISSINVKIGQYVGKGDVMVRLSPNVASPYNMARANYESTEKSINRLKMLQKEGGVSQETIDQVESGYEMAKANLEGARKAENLIAPFSGTVVEIYVPLNSVVNPGRNIIKIASLEKVRIKLTVSEAIIDRFTQGQTAFIVTGADTVIGKVEKVSLAADEASHTFVVETVFENKQKRFKPGMYVTVNIVTKEIENALVLPMESVISEYAKKYVYVVENGIARKRSVVTGVRSGSEYQIVEGLAEGETVVFTGSGNLSDNTKVKIIQR